MKNSKAAADRLRAVADLVEKHDLANIVLYADQVGSVTEFVESEEDLEVVGRRLGVPPTWYNDPPNYGGHIQVGSLRVVYLPEDE